MTDPIEITDVIKDENNVIKYLITKAEQDLTSRQASKKINKGQDMIYKETELQPLGDYVRSKPNSTTKDNLIQD